MMRLTNNMVSNRVLSDLQTGYKAMASTQEQVSTGKRVNRPSDDPTAAAQARLRAADLEGVLRSKDSVAGAQSWLGQAENGLSTVNDILSRAKELTLSAANGSLSQNDRNSIAAEIDQLTQAAKDAMNAKSGDAYIFSGTKSDAPPYSAATGDTYQGDTNAVVREAGPGVALQVNPSFTPVGGGTASLTADALLGGGMGAADGKVLATLQTLSSHLRSGTPADIALIGTSDLQALEANRVAAGDARSMVGATTNRADSAESRLADLEDATNQSIDDLTGADMVKAITTLTAQQSAYQASLKVGAQIIQPSLVDFLR
jgi:flagellar hook-associated protein 3 FlgL